MPNGHQQRPTREDRRRASLKASLRDRLAERIEADARRLLDEARGEPLDEQEAAEIVADAAQIAAFNIRREAEDGT